MTFGGSPPANCSQPMDPALFGRLGMSVTRKALAKDLAEIAAKAEQL